MLRMMQHNTQYCYKTTKHSTLNTNKHITHYVNLNDVM